MRPAKSNKLMGLDLGDQRIGIAVAFKETQMAIPKGHLNRGSLREDIKTLLELASEHKCRRIRCRNALHITGPDRRAS